MINEYGADSVRWFILSDSPPEKDVQWSDIGVKSANKFLQKIWNLNYQVKHRKEYKVNEKLQKDFIYKTDLFINKIEKAIENFQLNVCIAYFYEIYKFVNNLIESEIGNLLFKKQLEKIMVCMIPFTPHLAYECLELHETKKIDSWPEVNLDTKNIERLTKIAVQINGKTSSIIDIIENSDQKKVEKMILENIKLNQKLKNKKIKKIIFVKNRVINYLLDI